MEILVAILAIGGLVALHELGHFAAARLAGVRVEEFGIGLPPRIWGIRRGETLYSVNLIPLGGFVRMLGEDGANTDPRSFSSASVSRRLGIVLAGVLMFWVIAAALFGFVGATAGIPASSSPQNAGVTDVRVLVLATAPDSPAARAGILPGDRIVRMEDEGGADVEPASVEDVQAFVSSAAGQEAEITLLRGEERLSIRLVPREDPPKGEGSMGVQLVAAGMMTFSWWEAPWRGAALAANVTGEAVSGLWGLVAGLASNGSLPAGAQVAGPVGIVRLMGSAWGLGVPSFLLFLAQISVHLAVLSLLPLPALDGGRALLLAYEGVARRRLPERPVQHAIAISFVLLIALMLWITFAFDLQLISRGS